VRPGPLYMKFCFPMPRSSCNSKIATHQAQHRAR
jgi:hypothetical protein